MPAMPFRKAPTLGEFFAFVEQHFGVRRVRLQGTFPGPKGPTAVGYFERQDGAAMRRVEWPDYPDDQRLVPSKVRSLCVGLGIPPGVFELADEPTED